MRGGGVPVTEHFEAVQPAVIGPPRVRAQALLNQVQGVLRRVDEPCFGRGETGHFTGVAWVI